MLFMQEETHSSCQHTWCGPAHSSRLVCMPCSHLRASVPVLSFTAAISSVTPMQVEHRGVMPSLVPKPGSYLQIVDQRKQLREVIWSCWPAVSQPSPHNPDVPFVVSVLLVI